MRTARKLTGGGWGGGPGRGGGGPGQRRWRCWSGGTTPPRARHRIVLQLNGCVVDFSTPLIKCKWVTFPRTSPLQERVSSTRHHPTTHTHTTHTTRIHPFDWTGWVAHACENITFARFATRTVKRPPTHSPYTWVLLRANIPLKDYCIDAYVCFMQGADVYLTSPISQLQRIASIT